MNALRKVKLNKKGFTLAELLIVIAIIAILVAIAIPVFTGQLNKAKAGTDLANLRSAYAVAQTTLLTNPKATQADILKAIDAALPSVTGQYGTSAGSKIKYDDVEVSSTGTGGDTADAVAEIKTSDFKMGDTPFDTLKTIAEKGSAT